MAGKDEILVGYKEGLQALKKYELHPNLWKDPSQKQHLIDVYYNESSMNSFKNSCIVALEKLSLKMDPKLI